MRIRRPAAFSFYPSDGDEEKKEIKSTFPPKLGAGEKLEVAEKGKRKIIGAVVPHAGYVYSGPVAARVYYQLAGDGNPETFVILGPNHRGFPGFCIMDEGIWRMPLGDVQVDSDLAKAIVRNSQFVDTNPEAHDEEHSIEVQLPFLQYVYDGRFKIVPITVGYSDYGMCEDVGIAIAKAIAENERDAVVIGSTDFTHYSSMHYGYAPVGMKPIEKVLKWIFDVDNSLIDMILALDGKKLVSTVNEKGYTMCGSLPVATMLVATKELGAKNVKLLKYATSYDTQKSADAIVGYGAVIVTK
jgi:hypothetical protein